MVKIDTRDLVENVRIVNLSKIVFRYLRMTGLTNVQMVVPQTPSQMHSHSAHHKVVAVVAINISTVDTCSKSLPETTRS